MVQRRQRVWLQRAKTTSIQLWDPSLIRRQEQRSRPKSSRGQRQNVVAGRDPAPGVRLWGRPGEGRAESRGWLTVCVPTRLPFEEAKLLALTSTAYVYLAASPEAFMSRNFLTVAQTEIWSQTSTTAY